MEVWYVRCEGLIWVHKHWAMKILSRWTPTVISSWPFWKLTMGLNWSKSCNASRTVSPQGWSLAWNRQMGKFYNLQVAQDAFLKFMTYSKWPSTYFYSSGYVNVGPHRNQPIKTSRSLTVSITNNFAPSSTARVPKFEPTSPSDRESVALLYHDRLVSCTQVR